MSTNKDLRLTEEDLILWAKYVTTKQIPEGSTQAQIKRLSRREISLGDTSAIVTLLAKLEVEKSMESIQEQMGMLLQANSITNQVLVEKLNVTEEDFEEAEINYKKGFTEMLEELGLNDE